MDVFPTLLISRGSTSSSLSLTSWITLTRGAGEGDREIDEDRLTLRELIGDLDGDRLRPYLRLLTRLT
jgi:hypothetical protein